MADRIEKVIALRVDTQNAIKNTEQLDQKMGQLQGSVSSSTNTIKSNTQALKENAIAADNNAKVNTNFTKVIGKVGSGFTGASGSVQKFGTALNNMSKLLKANAIFLLADVLIKVVQYFKDAGKQVETFDKQLKVMHGSIDDANFKLKLMSLQYGMTEQKVLEETLKSQKESQQKTFEALQKMRIEYNEKKTKGDKDALKKLEDNLEKEGAAYLKLTNDIKETNVRMQALKDKQAAEDVEKSKAAWQKASDERLRIEQETQKNLEKIQQYELDQFAKNEKKKRDAAIGAVSGQMSGFDYDEGRLKAEEKFQLKKLELETKNDKLILERKQENLQDQLQRYNEFIVQLEQEILNTELTLLPGLEGEEYEETKAKIDGLKNELRDYYDEVIDMQNEATLHKLEMDNLERESHEKKMELYRESLATFGKNVMSTFSNLADATANNQKKALDLAKKYEKEGNEQLAESARKRAEDLKKTHEKQMKVVKAASIIQTTIDSIKGAQSAFTSLSGIPIVGPALGAVAAAAALAAGIANIQKIRSQDTSLDSPDPPSELGSVAPPTMPDNIVIPQETATTITGFETQALNQMPQPVLILSDLKEAESGEAIRISNSTF